MLNRRCQFNPFFSKPIVSTVDQFQGQQADYVLLSLVRTRTVGHLRDVRRLIVALSRARLGVYVFCRSNTFKSCKEIAPSFDLLLKRPTQLQLIENEEYGSCKRELDAKKSPKPKVIKDVVEMGSFVFEMSKEKLNQK